MWRAIITSEAELRATACRKSIERKRVLAKDQFEAKILKLLASKVGSTRQLLKANSIQNGLLVASGLSPRAIGRLDESAKTGAIARLIDNVLEPSGESFAEVLEHLYLGTKRRASNRKSLANALAYQRFFRTLISVLNLAGLEYKWKDTVTGVWLDRKRGDAGIESRVQAIYWKANGRNRLLATRTNSPLIGNVALALLDALPSDFIGNERSLFRQRKRYVALGELKGGIDPAGADEHWKTADTALTRSRTHFQSQRLMPPTFFIGAAIERSMAVEIVGQLEKGILNRAANLTKDNQLVLLCEWLVNL